MQPLSILAIACFAVGVVALAWGVLLEYRQTRAASALVPTQPYAWGAALLGTLGLVVSGLVRPWLALLLGPVLVVIFGAIVMLSGRRRA